MDLTLLYKITVSNAMMDITSMVDFFVSLAINSFVKHAKILPIIVHHASKISFKY